MVLGRNISQLEFLYVLLGDEPVLSPKARFYQRLLALDQQEAQTVVTEFLKAGSAIDLYDSVVIPALNMAEQDRHKGALDESKEAFIVQSISELIGDLAEYGRAPAVKSGARELRLICMPASDQADELTGAMLAQIAERAGYPVVSLPVAASLSAAVNEIVGITPQAGDVVCISALPPFALLNARNLSKRLRSRFPELKILVGLWTLSDGESAAERFAPSAVDTVVTTLAIALEQIHALAEAVAQDAPVGRE
jgi:hypothetical protein